MSGHVTAAVLYNTFMKRLCYDTGAFSAGVLMIFSLGIIEVGEQCHLSMRFRLNSSVTDV